MSPDQALTDARSQREARERREKMLWEASLAAMTGLRANSAFIGDQFMYAKAATDYAEALLCEFEKHTAPPATPPHRDQELERDGATR